MRWLCALLCVVTLSPGAATGAAGSDYVGSDACQACHGEIHAAWRGSHHARAMAAANEATVLGDFDDASFEHAGVRSRFFRRDGGFWVSTDDAEGVLREFPVTHTFGVYPLQQYLVPLAGGRLQALTIAWDSRAQADGGQRWFHLQGDETIDHLDPLHWTGIYQNWNFMCADCHATAVRRNYDPKTASYQTRWSEIGVGCEACHGPGAGHLRWSGLETESVEIPPDLGLERALRGAEPGLWRFVGDRRSATRAEPRSDAGELELCAGCHARRGRIAADGDSSGGFHDRYALQLLTEGAYHADGQMLDEVFVYGSFLQSRMHQAGVTCSDCHDPHSGAVEHPDPQRPESVCLQCHSARHFDSEEHHHHPPGSAGADCVACHMPPTSFMRVDERNDHSFRIPRPDLSVELELPNACSRCHAEEGVAWAAARVREWFPTPQRGRQRYGRVLHNARSGHPAAVEQLSALIANPDTPDIARATAVHELRGRVDERVLERLPGWLEHASPLVRHAAVGLLETLPGEAAVTLGAALLDDPVRLVRQEAARVLAFPGEHQRDPGFQAALREHLTVQTAQLERPESHTNLGNLALRQGRYRAAEQAWQRALALQPHFVAARINLADLYRRQGREADCAAALQAGLALAPDDPDLNHALGLQRVRTQQPEQAVVLLRRAAEAAPHNARYQITYAMALFSVGELDAAMAWLREAQAENPLDESLLVLLIDLNRQLGAPEAMRRYAERLQGLRSAGSTLTDTGPSRTDD